MLPHAHSNSRVHFIDVLRLLALAQMVNGHTLHAVLRDDVRHGDFYQGYLWFRGLVSVAFMLAAGVAFYITTVARFEQHRHDPAAFQRRVMRALLIVTIGFLLRLPLWALLTLDLGGLESGLMALCRIDVLPCIGVSLLALECVVRVGNSARQVVSVCAGLCVLCALAAPWGASLPSAGVIGFVTGWLGPQGGSTFPLLPFSGYVFAGVVLGAFALPAAGRTPARTTALRLTGAGLVLFALGSLAAHGPAWLARASSPEVQAPAFFATKLAAVTFAMAALSLCLRNLRALPAPLRVLTGETLAVYVFHLLVLYGFPLDLHGRIGTTLSLPRALTLSLLMLSASVVAGLGWHHIKRWHPARRFLPSERVALLASCSIVIGALLLVATRAFADPPVNTNGTHYAIAGYDPVAYFLDQHAAKGSPQVQLEYQGAIWLFASEPHKRTFAADPARYAPRYAGHCAFAAAQGRLVTIDPQAWSIVHDRLYLNYSLAIRDQWNADRERFIRLADAHFPPPSPKTGSRVRSIALTVADLDRATHFFVDTLGFRVERPASELRGAEFDGLTGLAGARARATQLALGSERVELMAFAAPTSRPAPPDSQSDDLWFQHLALVASDIDLARQRVNGAGAQPISQGLQTIPASNTAAAGIRAFYFRGPSQHPLELIWFPADKGSARWHTAQRPLLGIDHTAIAVSNSKRSRTFYEDLLGLRVVGHSFNHGSEQEALSGVQGARVRITSLRGEDGPGVEFLEYEAPRRGRTLPADTRTSDLWHSEITIAVADLDLTIAKLHAAATHFISDRPHELRRLGLEGSRGVLVADPDGHAVRVVQ